MALSQGKGAAAAEDASESIGAAHSEERQKPVYAGVSISPTNKFYVAIKENGHSLVRQGTLLRRKPPQDVIHEWIGAQLATHHLKLVALGIVSNGLTKSETDELASRAWLKEDAVPYIFALSRTVSPRERAMEAAARASRHFKSRHAVEVEFDHDRQVAVAHLTNLEEYERVIPREEFDRLTDLAGVFKEKKKRLCFFSSTSRGGGVAIMRHALIRLFRLLGVDAHWYVLNSEKGAFLITKKKFHNVLQGVAGPASELTAEDIAAYNEWIKRNAARLAPVFRRATMIVIDDPQPSGLIPYIKAANPSAKIIYRSHIHIESDLVRREATPQSKTWNFLWGNIGKADLFVSHPVREFIPRMVDPKKIVLMGATTDELDGLNKPLSRSQTDYYLSLFDERLRASGETPLDRERPYIVQIARFDPSKGIPDVLVAYRTLRRQLERKHWEKRRIPQLVIVGNGATDDPEGSPILTETMNRLKIDIYRPIANDVKVARLSHNDQILNAILSRSRIALQLSHREGFEIKVSEALAKGKPVIAYRAGGIPLQIEDGVTGYLVRTGDAEKVAYYLYRLLNDRVLYEKMSHNAEKLVRRDCFTAQNAINWLELATGKRPSVHPLHRNLLLSYVPAATTMLHRRHAVPSGT